jgi:VanZ family protein
MSYSTYFTYSKFKFLVFFSVFSVLLLYFPVFSQSLQDIQFEKDTLKNNSQFLEKDSIFKAGKAKPTKKWLLPTLAATTYIGGMTFLYQTWYKNENQVSFHFFNDNKQWNQLDKFGHAYTSYQLGKLSYHSFKSLNYPEKTALWSSTAGFWLMLPIEIFDGFSPTYGASYGDLIANGTGSLLFLSQQIAFKEQRIQFKFSFFPTSYSDLRPNTLGESLPTRIIKDYNGQTYWFSSSPSLWINKQINKQTNFPKWLAFSVGYGANNMLYGSEDQNNQNGYQSSRTFYLSLDINWSQIKTKRKGLQLLFGVFDGIKIPFPALYYDTQKGFNASLLAF